MSGLRGATWPHAVHVVVPCRDEEAALPGHLAALAAAVEHARRALPGTVVTATVVLDRCRDGSASIVRRETQRRDWLHALEVDRGCVGGARADGVALARRHAAAAARDTWVAHTDADSRVPVGWLLQHARAAREGLDLWLGTVRPEAGAAVVAAWAGQHDLGPGHAHVHGANLGVRLSAYDAAGGFAPLATGEDEALVRAVVAGGGVVGSDDSTPVLTSARLVGRAPAGFAAFLATLLLVEG